ncbi:MAG: hypothetical protein OEV66_07420, partial [Spirochaetia bacterium]|nr:hypothetical protein [Spirochaetia bacterium]
RKGVILKKDTEKSLRIYMESQFPWPLHNRDNILLAELEQNPNDKKVTILLTGKPDSIEKKKGLVRVVKSFGKVEFTPLGDGEVQVVFDFFMDPGGAIAAPIINLFSVDFPFLSLKKMGEVVRQSEYQMAQFSFIQELP